MQPSSIDCISLEMRFSSCACMGHHLVLRAFKHREYSTPFLQRPRLLITARHAWHAMGNAQIRLGAFGPVLVLSECVYLRCLPDRCFGPSISCSRPLVALQMMLSQQQHCQSGADMESLTAKMKLV